MDIQNRVVNYYKSNPFIQKYLKGINAKTNEILLNINGKEKNVTIEELEAMKSEADLITEAPVVPDVPVMPEASVVPVDTPIVASEPVVPEAPSMSIETPIEEEIPAAVETPVEPIETNQNVSVTPQEYDISKETLNDIKILSELKNKDGLDNLLKKFAVNPSTGLIDINTAISVVTRNTMDEVEKAIKNNYVFNSDSTLYDIEGHFEGQNEPGYLSEDEQIANSFNNIKIYIDASKMYPDQVNYNEAQIATFMQTYIKKVKEELHGSQGAVPATAPKDGSESVTNTPVTPAIQENAGTANASAGFADIFVLTVIVLVYAVIIINLILKIK